MPLRGKKKVLLVVEIALLLVFIGGLYVYSQINAKLDKIERPAFNKEKVVVNQDAPKITGYKTYALFGIDHRDLNAALSGENSDTIIIASVNNDTKDVKLVSVYRDTLLNLGDGTYSKANAAYAYGGPEQAITMLNTNLDLDITDYVTVNFNALTSAIDLLGGLDIPMSYAEIVHMNNYCVETSEETGKDYTPIELPETKPEDQEAIIGTYHLNGVQATSYCRIRYTASLDMGRTERQRRVIQMLVDKAKSAGLTTIFKIMDEIFPMVTTSVSKTEILKLLPTLIGYSLDDTSGFPEKFKFSNVKGSIIVPVTLETNVVSLHEFLYGTSESYQPSEQVKENSAKIMEIVGDAPLEEVQTTVPELDEQETDDSFFWTEENGTDWNPEEPEPEYEEPDYVEPDYVEPDYTEPDYTEPDYVEPDYTEPDYTEPDYSGGSGDFTDGGGEGYEEPDYVEPDGGGDDYVEPDTGGEADVNTDTGWEDTSGYEDEIIFEDAEFNDAG